MGRSFSLAIVLLMFAALFILALIALALFYAVDAASRALIPWQDDSLPVPKE